MFLKPPVSQAPRQYIEPPQYALHVSTAEKKKSLTPFIIAGAGVLVIALVVVGIVARGFGLFGTPAAATDTQSPGAAASDSPGVTANPVTDPAPTVNMPDKAAEEEEIAYTG